MTIQSISSQTTCSAPIAVIGGGIMGAAAAIVAAQQGMEVLWCAPPERARGDGADTRNYALSPLTVGLLKRLGVWPALEQNACAVTRMEVYSGRARVDLSASDAGSDYLSMMVLHGDLLIALDQAVKFRPNIHRINALPDRLEILPDQAMIEIADQKIVAQLVVGADGARSWVRGQSGILWGQRDYGQSGVVATFQAEHPHGSVAAQWFDQGEILALLPLVNPHQLSMVWSTAHPAPTSEAVIRGLAERITERTSNRFGKLALISDAVNAPLKMLLTDRQSSLRTVLIGDAAHTVHPLAGYGLNLGMQDLLSLETLWKSHRNDPGGTAAINGYEKSRHMRVKRVQWVLDLLQRAAIQTHPTFLKLREFGMRAVADIGPLRQLLIKQALSPQ